MSSPAEADPARFIVEGPESPLTVVLAHGAGAPMDSPFMDAISAGLAGSGIRVVRFEFPYMATRRLGGGRRPPDREPALRETWRSVVRELGGGSHLVIGGKSLGGRIASLLAGDLGARGLVCLGYPFHPPGKPDRLRTSHLAHLEAPTLVVQGTRDPLGNRDEVAGYELSPRLRIVWLEDGDHSFRPRRSSGRSERQNLEEAIAAVTAFVKELERSGP